ncbi:MAG TPA: ATP-binding protein [Steroidobacteraceae bacterium]|nr:ATP-binding protein [Steroidobacteraceae bacterium]
MRALDAAGLGTFEWRVRTDRLVGSERFGVLWSAGTLAFPCRLASLLRYVQPEDREALEAEMRAVVSARQEMQAEFRVTAATTTAGRGVAPAGPRGMERWVRMRAGPRCDARGAVLSVIGVCEEIGDRKRLEAERAALITRERELRAAAEQANRRRDEFLQVFSHELRSPLNAILGWNRILAVKRAGDAEIAAMTERIERSGKAQLRLVNDLLDIGRISSGKLRIEPRLLTLAGAVAAALEAARPIAAAKRIELLSSLDPAGEVYGDPDRLQQVVGNLLSNAIKFTHAGGRVEVSVVRRGEALEITVADTGQGIAQDLLPHVFERFRQEERTSRHTAGLGLGLALVRELVTLHRGHVRAHSEGPGQGATFTVTLPQAQARDSAASGLNRAGAVAAEQARRALAGLSILVVDDEADARAVVAETLQLEGAQVTVSDSAAAALQHWHSAGAHYDIVVTDIGMPVEDGYSLVRKLRSSSSGRHVIAIALTGYASQADREAALQAGFDVHVAKPVDFDDFVPMIARMARTAGPRAQGH